MRVFLGLLGIFLIGAGLRSLPWPPDDDATVNLVLCCVVVVGGVAFVCAAIVCRNETVEKIADIVAINDLLMHAIYFVSLPISWCIRKLISRGAA